MQVPCLQIHDAAVQLAPTPLARFAAWNARAQAINAADDAEYLADPAGYRLRSDASHDAALAATPHYFNQGLPC